MNHILLVVVYIINPWFDFILKTSFHHHVVIPRQRVLGSILIFLWRGLFFFFVYPGLKLGAINMSPLTGLYLMLFARGAFAPGSLKGFNMNSPG